MPMKLINGYQVKLDNNGFLAIGGFQAEIEKARKDMEKFLCHEDVNMTLTEAKVKQAMALVESAEWILQEAMLTETK